MNSRPSDRVRLAIPNKGRIAEPTRTLIEHSGLHVVEGSERRLIARTRDSRVEILFARPIDIPGYVATGVADMGITGHDMVVERQAAVEEILDLQFGRADVVLAVPDESGVARVEQLNGARIATEFPVITEGFFKQHGLSVSIVPVGGACEAAPQLGIADAIVDLTSSGSTLRMNRLHVLAEILSTSTRLIANPVSLAEKEERVGEICLALESVIRARGQRYVMMNVRRDDLPGVEAVLPSLSGPTVMEVAASENLVAVHAVVGEERIYSLINQLKRAGARDILVMPIERMVR
ncbi:MAG: ATP phosphoribosyltransferase [Methanomicrobiales archaeon]|nr:ATP phosphoribosyltransferase [Methanomicrobiales archaeon]MDI6875666.1 ATP phosphoribosyltransferase [Methanomicrobiales archaeon]